MKIEMNRILAGKVSSSIHPCIALLLCTARHLSTWSGSSSSEDLNCNKAGELQESGNAMLGKTIASVKEEVEVKLYELKGMHVGRKRVQ